MEPGEQAKVSSFHVHTGYTKPATGEFENWKSGQQNCSCPGKYLPMFAGFEQEQEFDDKEFALKNLE